MSETYRALTRKYRPQSFTDIVSQDHVSNTLMNAIRQGRLSHAYMFCGPRGVGKTTMARVLARVINEIDSSVDGESLNQTLNIIEMDAASNNKVEDVHHLRESVRIPPQNGRYKVFIVDEVHMLSKAAFNALLKTLEEPPEHAIFIFATTEPHKVLPTILSRVQRFDFKRISVDEIVQRLRKISLDEDISIDEESLHVIAKKADGALRDALGLMDQAIAFCGDTITHNELLKALNVVGTDRLFQFMNCVKSNDADAGLELINTLLQEGYDIQEFLIGLTEHLRNLYIAHHSPQMYLVEASEDTKEKYKQTATDFSRDDLMRMLHIVSEAQVKLKDASQPRIQFEITLLKLIHMQRTENFQQLLNELQDLKKNFSNRGIEDVKQVSASDEGHSEASDQNQTESVEQVTATENTGTQSESSNDDEPEAPSEGATLQPENEAREVPAQPVEEVVPSPIDEDFDLGKPAIETEVSRKARLLHMPYQNGNVAIGTTDAAPADQQSVSSAPGKLSLEAIRRMWPDFASSLTDRVPKVLELQIQRVQPVQLKGHELTIQCDNPLSQKMLEEQATELGRMLKEHTGVHLRFKATVVNTPESKSRARNPYERFKEIQSQDPILRELVERFGAELEY